MNAKKSSHRYYLWLTMALIMVIGVGCTPATPEPTNTPVPTAIPEPEQTATSTLEPTATQVPTETPDLAATEAAQAAEAAAALVDETIAPVLEDVGISTDRGYLAWVLDEPIRLTERSYQTEFYQSIADEEEYGDFVLYAQVLWDSTGGEAYCGIKFRSDRDLFDGDRYEFFVTRFSGLPWWDFALFRDGYIESFLTGSSYQYSSDINQDRNSVNEYVLVVDETVATAYVNGKRLGTVTVSNLRNGELGVLTYQDSGETTCEFQEMWLWSLDE
ncbi:MAG: hypothetical protein DWQ07_22815 [Chloroflexi bacterium]|nr:MAG: hypothetical protein DWQ07_22815 [Chloroflexota bacterium]MBL1193982.1 hypothetical protein [Chloroflexota bacterium]NOH11276.1 hypothetical protein [Chloroflexota bacterium]